MATVEIVVDPSAPEPVYAQIVAGLRRGIEEGRWRPRQQIPSARRIAEETGVAINTARKAVQVLIDEGLVYTVAGKGAFVAGKK